MYWVFFTEYVMSYVYNGDQWDLVLLLFMLMITMTMMVFHVMNFQKCKVCKWMVYRRPKSQSWPGRYNYCTGSHLGHWDRVSDTPRYHTVQCQSNHRYPKRNNITSERDSDCYKWSYKHNNKLQNRLEKNNITGYICYSFSCYLNSNYSFT